MIKMRFLLAALAIAMPATALAHPHVFADAKLEVVASDDGKLKELRNVWRFDDMFSSSVLMDFDANTDLKLEADELAEISKTIHESLADYDYFTFVTQDGKPVAIEKPDDFHVDFKDNQLLVFFAIRPKAPVTLAGTLSFGVYDPTLYTAIDFAEDNQMSLEGKGFGACRHKVVRPDPDEVISQNQANLTEAFFQDPANNDMGKMFATRLEVAC